MRFHENNVYDEAFRREGSHKGPSTNHYGMYYNVHLAARPISRLLEVGVHRGDSLRAWKSLYPQAKIVGIEQNLTNIKRKLLDITVVEGMSMDEKVADTLRSINLTMFDVIIDDANMTAKDIIETMENLHPLLKSDGLYVVEYIPDPAVLAAVLEYGLKRWSTVHRYKSMKKRTARIFARKDDGSLTQEHSYYADILFFEHKQESINIARPNSL